MRRPVGIFLSLLVGFSAPAGCYRSGPPPVQFNYGEILKKAFRFEGEGRAVPVTIEQSIEVDGTVTNDGMYFFFSSDRERGNFDIYLRSLADITTVRITSHPSRDSSPAISPSGRYLAFVSRREDPEGDIFVIKVDCSSLIKKAASSVSGVPPLDPSAVNLTMGADPVTKAPTVVRDDSPAWSPDSRMIAFSSARGGTQNIWIMERSGANPRKLTTRGGLYPRFSPDGKSIIFISYRDEGSNGDIYIVDVESGRERQVTRGPSLEMNPSFMRNASAIVYTLIDRDTSGDGKLDLKDNSVIYYKNLTDGSEYPLTLYSGSSFSPRWAPLYEGIVVYSEQVGRNININIIPERGVIPLRESAAAQYDLAVRYLREFDDAERYLMGLERVYFFFGKKRDVESQVLCARALADAAVYYRQKGNRGSEERIRGHLAFMASAKNEYAAVTLRYLDERKARGNGAAAFLDSLYAMRKKAPAADMVPYLLEALGDEYARIGRPEEASAGYREIITSHPGFKRIIHVKYKLAVSGPVVLKEEISPYLLQVLNTNITYLRNDAVAHVLKLLESEKDLGRRSALIDRMMVRYRNVKPMPGLLLYAAGSATYQAGDLKTARTRLLEALKLAGRTDLLSYKANALLGTIAERERNPVEMEKHYAEVANNYQTNWPLGEAKKIALKLVDYYEDYGERAEYAGNYREAAALYKKYVHMLTYLHLRKRFEDLYNEHGARAHVLYIDAGADMIGDDFIKLQVIEKEYLNRLNIARMDFDKAHLYGLGYLYARMALVKQRDESEGIKGVLQYFKMGINQLDWALFIDDTFMDPYLLKGWIYQYVDLVRSEDLKLTGGRKERTIEDYFPRHLWENSTGLYEKALATNPEAENPETEGNLHLNLANTYFLLNNYPRALEHYRLTARYKRNYSSKTVEAFFHYHYGYCLWQSNLYAESRDEMNKALFIYQMLGSGKNLKRYRYQVFYLYRFFALLARAEKDHRAAIEWYVRTLDFARANRIHVDRARYLQEIASCYRDLGEEETALSYLDRAWALLGKYRDTREQYKMRWKVLGLGPLRFYDLGPDIAVIGDNRVYTELNTADKRLLNVSLQEEIHHERGDYAGALTFLQRKNELLKKPVNQTEREAAGKTLNNIGFAWFRMGEYRYAREYFLKAWDYAARKEINDLNGIFASIINLTNLYAFQLESGAGESDAAAREIEELASRVMAYRDGYETSRYQSELKRLEQEARTKKSTLSPEELSSLRGKIREDALRIYYSLDIALGILKFYKADTMPNVPQGKVGTGTMDRAYEIYADNRDRFALYNEARIRFEAALVQAGERISKRLKVKLLLNLASCQERIGMISEAYESYGEAENDAAAYEYGELKWQVYAAVAGFLLKHGAEIEGKDYRTVAWEYYRRALREIEVLPALYAADMQRILRIYDGYAGFLIDTGRHNEALEVMERKSEAERIMSLYLLAPEFRSADDNRDYRRFRESLFRLKESGRQVSDLLESGQARDSEKVRQEIAKLDAVKKSVGKLAGDLQEKRPLLASYMKFMEDRVKLDPDTAGFRFFIKGGNLYGWAVTSEGTVFRNIGAFGSAERDTEVRRFMDSIPRGRRLVVLDKHSGSLLGALAVRNVPTAPLFVPSLGRARYLNRNATLGISGVYADQKGIINRIAAHEAFSSVIFEENGQKKTGSLLYSLIIDAGGENVAQRLFRGDMRPTVLVKGVTMKDIRSMHMMMEACMYAGVDSLIMFSGLDYAGIAGLVQELAGVKSAEGAARGLVLRWGAPGSAKIAGKGKDTASAERLYASFQKEYAAGNLREAEIRLLRWKTAAGNAPDVESLYWLKKSEIETAEGRHDAAVQAADKALGLSATGSPGIFANAVSMKISLLLWEGDITAADELMRRTNTALSGTLDGLVYNSIVRIMKGESQKTGLQAMEGLKSLVSRDRLRILQALYLSLAGMETVARNSLHDLAFDIPLSERELCAAVYMGTTPPGGIQSPRVRGLAKLARLAENPELLRREAALLAEKEGGYDDSSPFIVLSALRIMVDQSRFDQVDALVNLVDQGALYKKGHWTGAVLLGMSLETIYRAEDKSGDALNTLGAVLEALGQRPVPMVRRDLFYRQAALYAFIDRYFEAYESARAGEKLLIAGDTGLSTRYGLLLAECEISLGRFDDASRRLDSIDKSTPEVEFAYALHLLRARLEMAKIIRQKKAEERDWKTVESLVLKGLEAIDRNPESLVRFNKAYMVFQSLDFLISYKMSRKDYLTALLYAEISKQIRIRLRFPETYRDSDIPDAIRTEFKNIRDRRAGGDRFVQLLDRYPGLMSNSLIASLPVDRFQKKIPENAVVLYLTRNGNDILAWVIDRRFIEPLRLKDGYSRAASASGAYRNALATFGNTITVSRDLYSVFSPLERFYRSKKTVIFCTDSHLERVPFEIMGDKNMLEESHSVVFLSSILSGLREYHHGANQVVLVEPERPSIYADLEITAIRQSGIPFRHEKIISGDRGHVLSPVYYNPLKNVLMVNGKPYTAMMKNARTLYFSGSDGTGILGNNELALYNSLRGVNAMVVNDAEIRDVNGAVFVDGFYTVLRTSGDVLKAFEAAKTSVRGKRRFSYPAYWAEIRLYINGL